MQSHHNRQGVEARALQALKGVLPASAQMSMPADHDCGSDILLGERPIQLKWIGEGNLADARSIVASRDIPDVVVARRMSPGARKILEEAGVGWLDETGAAEIAIGGILISRTGRSPPPRKRELRWTRSVIAVAEALLCGVEGTVSAMERATGLSTGSCTAALRTLTDLGLLAAHAGRGPGSGRRVVNLDRLLESYASAAAENQPAKRRLQIGIAWRDPVTKLAETAKAWERAGIPWATTGAVAASVIAPYLTSVSATEVYVDAKSIIDLEAVAREAGLRPLEGGRLSLSPFPTTTVRRLAQRIEGLSVAPWPRVYIDLTHLGVRGEEAAEHLREVVNAGRSTS